MGTWGASTLTGLLLHLGWGEPGRGGLLPVSCRGGEGRWRERGRGLPLGTHWKPPHLTPREGSRQGGLRSLGSPGCWSAVLPTDMIAGDASPCVAILQVIIIAKLCQSCPGSGPPGGEGREAGEGAGTGVGAFIFSTDCQSQFVGLPLRLLLKTLLMLRESGRSRLGAAPPPQVPSPLLPGRRPCLALSMPRRGFCCVRAMEADSQSGRFKLCDLARQAVRG